MSWTKHECWAVAAWSQTRSPEAQRLHVKLAASGKRWGVEFSFHANCISTFFGGEGGGIMQRNLMALVRWFGISPVAANWERRVSTVGGHWGHRLPTWTFCYCGPLSRGARWRDLNVPSICGGDGGVYWKNKCMRFSQTDSFHPRPWTWLNP